MSFFKKLINFFKKKTSQKNPTPISNSTTKKKFVLSSKDIKAIAGDNIMATQLDLARAYIEVGKKVLAKKILHHVIAHGDATQKQEANFLIEKMSL